MNEKRCTRCRRGMVPQQRYRTADQETRQEWRRRRIVRSEARGLCQSCYRWATNHGALVDHERLTRSWAEVLEDYQFLHNPMRTQAENVRNLAPRLGMTEDALHHALVVNRVRSRFDSSGRLKGVAA